MFSKFFKTKPKTKSADEVLAYNVRSAAEAYNEALKEARAADLNVVVWTSTWHDMTTRKDLIMDYPLTFIDIKRHDIKSL